jgi:hypothetical protein
LYYGSNGCFECSSERGMSMFGLTRNTWKFS